MSANPATLTDALERYLHACRRQFQPLLDQQPWSEIAVNPAPVFRAMVFQLEQSTEFDALVQVFGDWLEWEGITTYRVSIRLRLGAFLRAYPVYDAIIIGQTVDAPTLVQAMQAEARRSDIRLIHAAYLEGFACAAEQVAFGEARIRHLTPDEIHRVFVGQSHLNRTEPPEETHREMHSDWFVTVERPTKAFNSLFLPGGTIGLHDFKCSPIPDINLALNLFKPANGPVVIRKLFHWETTLFGRRMYERPCYGEDMLAGSWSGQEERPRLINYVLTEHDAGLLSKFWLRFEDGYVRQQRFFPMYLHRAISRFLHACQWDQCDWEFRQMLYIIALEALFCGEDDERPTFADRKGDAKPVGVKRALTRCCANLLAPDRQWIGRVSEWLEKRYEQRSDVAHGSAFEQELFVETLPSDDEHRESVELANMLGLDADLEPPGPEVDFGILHNLVRLSILFFVEHACAAIRDPGSAQIIGEIKQLPADAPGGIAVRRRELRERLSDRLHQDRCLLVKRIYEAFQREPDRLAIRRSLGGLASLCPSTPGMSNQII